MGLNASHKNARNIIVDGITIYDNNLDAINNIPNLMARYRSDFVTKDGSNKISQIDDISGNELHLTQSTGANQFTWMADQINGKPAIKMETLQYMDVSSGFDIDQTDDVSQFLVYRKASPTTRSYFLFDSTNTFYSVIDNHQENFTVCVGDDYEVFDFGGNTNYVIVAHRGIPLRPNDELWIKGKEINRLSSNNIPITPTNTFDEFGRFLPYYNTETYFVELLFFNRLLTDDEIETVTKYLSDYYNIRTHLGHYTAQDVLNKADQLQLRADPYYETESFTDDFITGRSTVDNQLGDWNWNTTFIGNGSCTFLPSEINHPGIIELNVDGGESSLCQSKVTRIVPNMVFETQLKFPIVNYLGITRPFWGIGNSYRGTWEQQTRAVGFRITSNIEVNLQAYCRDAAGTTSLALPGLLSSGVWYNFRWEYDGTTVFFYIDEVDSINRNNYTKVFESTTNIPTGVDLEPVIGMTGPATVSMQCDYVHLEHQVIK